MSDILHTEIPNLDSGVITQRVIFMLTFNVVVNHAKAICLIGMIPSLCGQTMQYSVHKLSPEMIQSTLRASGRSDYQPGVGWAGVTRVIQKD